MCGRYTISTKISLFGEYFDAQVPAEEVRPNYNATPSMMLPVILDEDPKEILLAKWGFLPHWAKDKKLRAQPNARLDTADVKPMFREAFKRHHCLILADGFYEWRTDGKKKTPFRIVRKDRKPFAMAGIWDAVEGEKKVPTYAILTTDGSKIMEPIHNRMPVLLKPGHEKEWLDSPLENHAKIVSMDDSELDAYEVSADVNKPINNRPEVMQPV